MKRYLTLGLASVLLFSTHAAYKPALAQTPKETQLAARIKTDVNSFGHGRRVSVKLRNNNKLVGYIDRIGDADFTLTVEATSTTQTIAYTEALQVKRQDEKRISTGAKAAIIVIGTLFVLSLLGNGFGG